MPTRNKNINKIKKEIGKINKKNKGRGKNGKKTYHEFDIGDKTWEKIDPHLTVQRYQHSGIAKNNRKFIDAVIGY